MIFLSEDEDLSAIEKKADEILKGHNGVYLDNRLYSALRKDFPKLSRKDFRKVLDNLINTSYSMERGLIRPLTENEINVQMKEHEEGKNSGKGSSERNRLPNKRGI